MRLSCRTVSMTALMMMRLSRTDRLTVCRGGLGRSVRAMLASVWLAVQCPSAACRISASCDLTKLYEKTIRGTAEEVLALLSANEKAEKGEYCLVLDLHGTDVGKEKEEAAALTPELALLERMLQGETLREAAAALNGAGLRRNEVYRAKEKVRAFLEDAE